MLRRIAIAAITATVLFYTAVFIKLGTIWFLDVEAMKELFTAFLFLLPTFWAHEKIAEFYNSDRLAGISAEVKAFLEAATVIVLNVIFTVVFIFIPQYLLIPTIEFSPEGIRLILVITSFLALFFYYFVERERWKKKLQEELLRTAQLQKENFKAQLESLKNQVNPHFLFNSLNVLGSLIYKNQNQAVHFLSQLSDVYRTLLDTGESPLVPLQTEMELANAYIYLMKTRFGNNLHFEFDVPADKLQLQLPPTSVQMLLENAIKHNGSTANKPLLIKIYVKDEMLVVENNLQPRLDPVASTGIGLQNIVNRYSHLTSKQVEIAPTEHAFIVRLPLLQAEEV